MTFKFFLPPPLPEVIRVIFRHLSADLQHAKSKEKLHFNSMIKLVKTVMSSLTFSLSTRISQPEKSPISSFCEKNHGIKILLITTTPFHHKFNSLRINATTPFYVALKSRTKRKYRESRVLEIAVLEISRVLERQFSCS